MTTNCRFPIPFFNCIIFTGSYNSSRSWVSVTILSFALFSPTLFLPLLLSLLDTDMGGIVSALAFPAPAKEISQVALLSRVAQNQLFYLETQSGHHIPAIYIQYNNNNNNNITKTNHVTHNNNINNHKSSHHRQLQQQQQNEKDYNFTLIYSHGNAEDVGLSLPYLDYLSRYCRCHVLAYEYCGYSIAEGEPSEQNCYQCIQAAYDFLTTQQNVDPGRIVLFGRSLGTGECALLYSRQEKKGVKIGKRGRKSHCIFGNLALIIMYFSLSWCTGL
jgi:hypothetical protein